MNVSKLLILSGVLSIQSAYAVLGPVFPDSERPHSICAIEFYQEGTEELEEVCSAVVVSETRLLTAAHCTEGLPQRSHKIICRDDVGGKIKKTTINDRVNFERLKYFDDEHRLDTALLETDRPLQVPALRISQDQEETLSIIESTKICGIFGHGGFHDSLRKFGLSTQSSIDPRHIVFDGDLIRIKGIGGRNAGLVEPGDSGGSLSCQLNSGEWMHIAQVSGRTMYGESLLAPVYLFQNLHLGDYSRKYSEKLKKWKDEDLEKDLSLCLKSYNVFVKKDFKRTEDKSRDIQQCRKALFEETGRRLQKKENLVLKVRPYSLIDITQEASMIPYSANPGRLLKGTNPFSTVDQVYNQFSVVKVEGDSVYGNLLFYSYSESFLCLENVLCDEGVYRNVRVNSADLVYPDR